MTRLYAGLGAAALLLALVWGGYSWAHRRGEADGYGICKAEYVPMLEARDRAIQAYQDDATARAVALIAAQKAKADAEAKAARDLEEQSNAYTDRINRLQSGIAGARRELDRLRDNLATASVSAAGGVHVAQTSGTRSPVDGAAAGLGGIAADCAGRYLTMGELAAKLAEQVTGLQSYARVAHQACGR